MEQFVSTENVARFLGVSRPTVIKYIQEDRLPAMRSGKAYKISKGDLTAFARHLGMNETRIADLDQFLRNRNKKTRSLDRLPVGASLTANDPVQPLAKDPEVLYFISIRDATGSGEFICRVLTMKFFIGRHSLASLSIRDPYVSTLHTTLVYQDGLVQVLDQSTNGTQVGNQLLKAGQTCTIGDGDQLQVANTVLTILSPDRADFYLGSQNPA